MPSGHAWEGAMRAAGSGREHFGRRKPEERERHDALRRDCVVAGMLHAGPVLRTRSRTASGGRAQRTTAPSPSNVGEADFKLYA